MAGRGTYRCVRVAVAGNSVRFDPACHEKRCIFGSSDVSVGGLGTVARRTPLSP